MYSRCYNSKYNKLIVLHRYFVFLKDFVCYLFSDLSFCLFCYLVWIPWTCHVDTSVQISNKFSPWYLSSKFYSENNSEHSFQFSDLQYSILLIPKSWDKSLKEVQHISWSRSPFQHLVGLDLMSGVPKVTSIVFLHLIVMWYANVSPGLWIWDPKSGKYLDWPLGELQGAFSNTPLSPLSSSIATHPIYLYTLPSRPCLHPHLLQLWPLPYSLEVVYTPYIMYHLVLHHHHPST